MKDITMADVALKAGVSKSTVSQFINRRYEYMADATKKRIEAAINELGYRPNQVAKSLKLKRTATIGVIVANILHSFSTQILRTLENYFNANGFHVIICNADDEPEKERNYIEMLLAKQVDGLIIFPTGGNIDLYIHMKERSFPVVFMDRKIEGFNIETVMLDNYEAARLAINRFIVSDYKMISIITTSIIRNISPRMERIEGYKKALEENSLPLNPDYIKTADANHLQIVLKELFSLDIPPNAILAGNDIVLIEVLKYMKENLKRIPEDVAVIGIDEVSFASFYTPPLTVVAQPTDDMANQAAKLLMDQIEGKKNESEKSIYRMVPKLIERNSC